MGDKYCLKKLPKHILVPKLEEIWKIKKEKEGLCQYSPNHDMRKQVLTTRTELEFEVVLENFIKQQREFYQKIITFEPINLDQFYQVMMARPQFVSISKKMVAAYLDRKGIIYQ